MRNYTGRISANLVELEDRLHRCKDDRIYIIECGNEIIGCGDEIARVCEVNKNTGHIYRNLCCKIDSDDNNSALRIRKRLMGVRGIRKKSL